ncbi:MAG: hypothetical protein Q7U08_03650 [Flavobacteriaceae bacterium]|nr:hypothetical protein [Flavobacteriaceae bacterium]
MVLIFLIIFGPLYVGFKNGKIYESDSLLIIIFIGVVAVMNIPAFILYLNYYFENKNTEFQIDTNNGIIKIVKNGIIKEYEINQIEKSTYNLGIYYKNAIDKGMRIPMTISNLGYWDLKFKNGDRYYLTNLLHDFLLENPIIKNTKYRFRFYQYIDKSDTYKTAELKRVREKSLIEKFVEQYDSKSEKQLKDILDNKKHYQIEAVRAAEIVLNKKTLGNTS